MSLLQKCPTVTTFITLSVDKWKVKKKKNVLWISDRSRKWEGQGTGAACVCVGGGGLQKRLKSEKLIKKISDQQWRLSGSTLLTRFVLVAALTDSTGARRSGLTCDGGSLFARRWHTLRWLLLSCDRSKRWVAATLAQCSFSSFSSSLSLPPNDTHTRGYN